MAVAARHRASLSVGGGNGFQDGEILQLIVAEHQSETHARTQKHATVSATLRNTESYSGSWNIAPSPLSPHMPPPQFPLISALAFKTKCNCLLFHSSLDYLHVGKYSRRVDFFFFLPPLQLLSNRPGLNTLPTENRSEQLMSMQKSQLQMADIARDRNLCL